MVFTLTTFAVVAGLVIQFFFGNQNNRNSHEQRLLIVRRILQETPLIGENLFISGFNLFH